MSYKPKVLAAVDGGTGLNAAGTSGNVLTSDGTNWNSSAPSGGFSPNSIVTIYDEFFCNNGGGFGLYQWGNENIIQSNTLSVGHPGIVILDNQSANADLSFGIPTGSNFSFILGGGNITLNWVADLIGLSTLTNTYLMQIGMIDNFAFSSSPNVQNGVYFTYTNAVNSGNWVMNCANGGVLTSTNTAIPATTGFHNYGITINAAASSVSFTIDGVSAGAAITTNIPVNVIAPYFGYIYIMGSIPLMQVDLFYLTQNLTTSR